MVRSSFISRGVILALGACLAASPIWAQEAPKEAPSVEITLQGDKFSPSEVKVPSGKPLVFKFLNKEPVPAEIEAKDLKIEKVVAAGGEVIVRVRPLKPGRYLFVNEYKEDSVKGYVVVE